MSTQKINVMDTVIDSVERLSANGRAYAVVGIRYEGLCFQPGQMLVVNTTDREICWPHAYLIQQKTESGVTLLCPQNSPLHAQQPGAGVVVWGPRGTTPLPNGADSCCLVTEAAAYHAVLPFLLNRPESVKNVLFYREESQPLLLEALTSQTATGPQDTAKALIKWESERYLVALNPENLLMYVENMPESILQKSYLYIPTKIGCGVGACMGCVIHSEKEPIGIKICCKGPFIPAADVNVKEDMHSFLKFGAMGNQ